MSLLLLLLLILCGILAFDALLVALLTLYADTREQHRADLRAELEAAEEADVPYRVIGGGSRGPERVR